MSVSILFLACKCIHIQKCLPILFYHPKELLYQLYHIILQYTQHPKNQLFYHFIKILFFNISLLFLSHNHFFFKFSHDSNGHIFLGIFLKYYFLIFPIVIFFSNRHFDSNSHIFLGLYHFFPTIIFFQIQQLFQTCQFFFSFVCERTCQISM